MIRVAILTISDSAAAGTREDLSGPAIRTRCQELNWPVVAAALVGDDEAAIASQLKEWTDNSIATVILTTGGTGVAPRDVTPEATRRVIEREIPGIAESMRSTGLNQTKFSILSRAVAGTRGTTLIVNFPGSPRGALYSFNAIEGVIPHLVDLLAGRTGH